MFMKCCQGIGAWEEEQQPRIKMFGYVYIWRFLKLSHVTHEYQGSIIFAGCIAVIFKLLFFIFKLFFFSSSMCFFLKILLTGTLMYND